MRSPRNSLATGWTMGMKFFLVSVPVVITFFCISVVLATKFSKVEPITTEGAVANTATFTSIHKRIAQRQARSGRQYPQIPVREEVEEVESPEPFLENIQETRSHISTDSSFNFATVASSTIRSRRHPIPLPLPPRKSNKSDTALGGMNEADENILVKYYNNANSIMEWGVGTSTKYASTINVPRYTGVDGAIGWIQMVAESAPSHFRLVWADIGKIGTWSVPKDPLAKPKWPFYSKGVLAQESEAFDVYFVDGRFRVACALASFIHATQHGRKPGEYHVIVHDFSSRTMRGLEGYGELLDIATIIEGHSVRNSPAYMVVLELKPEVTMMEVEALYYKYQYAQR